MNTGLGKVNLQEIGHAAINAVIAALVIGLGSVVSQPNFDVFTISWGPVIHSMINWGFAAFIGAVGKSFGTTANGNFLGVVSVKK